MARLTEEEMKKMNEIIRPRFGANLQIIAGSRDENGTYHLAIGDHVRFVSEAAKQRIAKTLKEEYDDAIYFSGGSRIA